MLLWQTTDRGKKKKISKEMNEVPPQQEIEEKVRDVNNGHGV